MISLWILAILSLLCLGLAHRVIINLKLVKFQKDKMKCLYIAKAAIQKAISVLEKDATSEVDGLGELWSRGFDQKAEGDGYIFKNVGVDDGFFTVSYLYDDTNSGSSVYFYGMSDEDRKININEANKELLVSLLDILGASDSESLADNIIYWRGDASENTKDPYYESPQIPYPARKAPLKTIEELSLVKGFRDNLSLVKECEKFFTVYTQDNLININTTRPQILKAVFMSLGAESVTPGLSDRLVNDIIDFRDGDDGEATDDDVLISQDEIKNVIKKGLADIKETGWVNNQVFPFTVKSNLFRIDVSAGLNNSKISKKVTVIIDRSKQPLQIRYWHEE